MKNSRFFKKFAVVFALTAICLGLCGCTDFVLINILGMEPDEVAYYKNPEGHVAFSQGEDTEEHYLTVDEVMAYQTAYPECNGEYYKSQLDGEDLLMYNCYLYAMENSYTTFALYVEDNEKDFSYIRHAVCLDSPFLEQNINSGGETYLMWTDGKISYTIEQFTADRWALKMQALEVLKQVVENIPAECDTQTEKMLYLYHYVCDRVEYDTREDNAFRDFLYDAVCQGKSNCDGYSNMYSLLLNLAGVECCETMGDDVEDESLLSEEELLAEEGHTWVVAKIGENYYNFDPTYEDTNDDFMDERVMYFAFSDELVTVKYFDCEDTRPKCTDTSLDFDYVQFAVENLTAYEEIRKIANHTDQQTSWGNYISYILVKGKVSDEVHDAFLDEYINMVYHISHVTTTVMDVGDDTVLKVETKPW